MKCPKCGFRQGSVAECQKCGLIFAKYEALQEKKQLQAQGDNAKKSRGIFSGVFLAVVILVALGVGMYIGKYNSDRDGTGYPNYSASKAANTKNWPREQSVTSRNQKRPVSWTTPEDVQPKPTAGSSGLAGQLDRFAPTSNPVELARNATVSLVSPWGSGSGFFVDSHGTIITNRHVVEVDTEVLNKARAETRRLGKYLENEKKNLVLIHKDIPKISDKAVRKQVKRNTAMREEAYQSNKKKYATLKEKLRRLEEADFVRDGKVVLIDGTEYRVSTVQVSQEHDLAMLSIYVYNSPSIKPVKPGNWPSQGQKVFTIGSPAGLGHTVTSGVISGYREYEGKKLVQIDAPINPGNSGGPLITEAGQVLGVNTLIIRDTEGIGFAIPFETVEQVFPLSQ